MIEFARPRHNSPRPKGSKEASLRAPWTIAQWRDADNDPHVPRPLGFGFYPFPPWRMGLTRLYIIVYKGSSGEFSPTQPAQPKLKRHTVPDCP